MTSTIFDHATKSDGKLNVKPGRGSGIREQHDVFAMAEGGRGKIAVIQKPCESLGIVAALFKAAKNAIKFNPIVQRSDFQLCGFSHEALANQAIKTGRAQPYGG